MNLGLQHAKPWPRSCEARDLVLPKPGSLAGCALDMSEEPGPSRGPSRQDGSISKEAAVPGPLLSEVLRG